MKPGPKASCPACAVYKIYKRTECPACASGASFYSARIKSGLAAARMYGRFGGKKKVRDDAKILKLRDQGLSIRKIAAKLKISKGSVQACLQIARCGNKVEPHMCWQFVPVGRSAFGGSK